MEERKKIVCVCVWHSERERIECRITSASECDGNVPRTWFNSILSALGLNETKYAQMDFNGSFLLRYFGTLIHSKIGRFSTTISNTRCFFFLYGYFFPCNTTQSVWLALCNQMCFVVSVHFLNSRSYCHTHTHSCIVRIQKKKKNWYQFIKNIAFFHTMWDGCMAPFSPFFLIRIYLLPFNSLKSAIFYRILFFSIFQRRNHYHEHVLWS